MASFPIELLREILQYCEQKTLFNSSLVGRSWYTQSVPFLYHTPLFTSLESYLSFSKGITEDTGRHVDTLDLSQVPHRWDHLTSSQVNPVLLACSKLRRLNLELCQIDDTVLQVLANSSCDTIEELNLNECLINDEGLSALVNCKKLRSLEIETCPVTDRSVIEIANACVNLERLNLARCEEITDESIAVIRSNLKQLRYLSVEECYGVLEHEGWAEATEWETDWGTDTEGEGEDEEQP
ncbi:RNI-like protein [Basidiobolus meristosporus CBS 931.73]|uniref:RNI-like protein n=1 Tax=Basidiobolus meristosporus CBS 931.73 TaxID=1314790 RepID=A0A1Y1ZDA6_9FUNG|nr:RNI-like protein [Basidiobolus meristosporus CBS 931.73]|eukprot:ORY08272.1 RNI-like protein [Basidiobolus meristosporus CBS 931.73]